MTYTWNTGLMGDVFVLPGDIVDNHLRLAGSAQLKILLWCARTGRGRFDAQACSAAIGLSPADCLDALQYWLQTGVLSAVDGDTAAAAPAVVSASVPISAGTGAAVGHTVPPVPATIVMPPAKARPSAVKPQLDEVLARQQESADFAALLDTVSARIGRPLSHGDMSTLLYLFDTAGLPAEVIVMVAVYAVTIGKANMRYIEKVALDWADKGIVTIAAVEQELCRLEHRRQATEQIQQAFGLTQSPTLTQSDAAYKWIWEWHMPMDLIRLAGEQCIKRCEKFNYGYVGKILEHWHADGITTPEQVNQAVAAPSKVKKSRKATSFDVDAYDEMALRYQPVYTPGSSK